MNLRTKDRQTVINAFAKIAKNCRAIPMRPVGRNLGYAARSLERAIININNGRIDLAKRNLKSAIKNLEYPDQT
jgi:hypothetical protein